MICLSHLVWYLRGGSTLALTHSFSHFGDMDLPQEVIIYTPSHTLWVFVYVTMCYVKPQCYYYNPYRRKKNRTCRCSRTGNTVYCSLMRYNRVKPYLSWNYNVWHTLIVQLFTSDPHCFHTGHFVPGIKVVNYGFI